MSWLSDGARCAGPVAIWVWRDRRIGMRPNLCRIVERNSTSGGDVERAIAGDIADSQPEGVAEALHDEMLAEAGH